MIYIIGKPLLNRETYFKKDGTGFTTDITNAASYHNENLAEHDLVRLSPVLFRQVVSIEFRNEES